MNQHIVMKVDNISCYYGWQNKNMSGDAYASIILRAIYLITCYLCCVLHVDHLPRMSTWEGRLVDRLSRSSSVLQNDKNLIRSFDFELPLFFKTWLTRPTVDWNLPVKLLNYVMNKT